MGHGPKIFDQTGAPSITTDQVVVGNGSGITSFDNFTFDGENLNHGRDNTILNSVSSSIITASSSYLSNSYFSKIDGGIFLTMSTSVLSSISGYGNCTSGSFLSQIIGGKGNQMYGSDETIILGGHKNCLSSCTGCSTIVGGYNNLMYNAITSSILGGNNNVIATGGNRSSIIGGISNVIRCNFNTTINGGNFNYIKYGNNSSSIVGGYQNCICYYSQSSTINGGGVNLICCYSSNSSILNGFSNTITKCSCRSSIISGNNNIICSNSCNSVIIGGNSNTICVGSSNSAIIGGTSSQIELSYNSAIIGGIGLTLSNECSLVYVPELKMYTSQQDDTLGKIMVWDDTSSKKLKWRDVNTISGSSITPGACELVLGNSSGTGLTWSSRFRFGLSESNINFGVNHQICNNNLRSTIIGGQYNIIATQSNCSSIIGGHCNSLICNSSKSSIVGGYFNSICYYSTGSSIVGGCFNNLICQSMYSSIVGGVCNTLYCSYCSSVIGGKFATISNSSNSAIIGGLNLTLTGESEVVYVPKLKIATASNANSSRILVWDTDKYVKWRDISSLNTPISSNQIAFGTGAGITSSCNLCYDGTNQQFVIGATSTSGVLSFCNNFGTPRFSGIIGGIDNLISGGAVSMIISSKSSRTFSGGDISGNSVSMIANSFGSTICNKNDGSIQHSSILSSYLSTIISGGRSSIISSVNSTIAKSQHGIIIGSTGSCIKDPGVNPYSNNGSVSIRSIILSSATSCISGTFSNSTIINSTNSCIIGENCSFILGGVFNKIYDNRPINIFSGEGSGSSVVILSMSSVVCDSTSVSIMTSRGSCIITSTSSSIYNGYKNCISTSCRSTILNGCCNSISNSVNTLIIGSDNVTINNACCLVKVPKLNVDATLGTSSYGPLVWNNSDDKLVSYIDTPILSGTFSTDSSSRTIYTITLTSGQIFQANLRIINSNSNGTNHISVSYDMGAVNNNGTVTTYSTSPTSLVNGQSVTISNAGTTVNIVATGAAGVSIWKYKLDILKNY
jgi:hypothetical protein